MKEKNIQILAAITMAISGLGMFLLVIFTPEIRSNLHGCEDLFEFEEHYCGEKIKYQIITEEANVTKITQKDPIVIKNKIYREIEPKMTKTNQNIT